jgi:mono/diheme cytochrome c family protein
MTTGTALATLTLSLACALTVTSASAQNASAQSRKKPVFAATSTEIDAAGLYTANCERCHGNGNSETKELNFADGDWRHGSSQADVIKTITDGVAGTAMLPWKDRFTEEEIAALARYVRNFDKSLAPAGTSRTRGRKK